MSCKKEASRPPERRSLNVAGRAFLSLDMPRLHTDFRSGLFNDQRNRAEGSMSASTDITNLIRGVTGASIAELRTA